MSKLGKRVKKIRESKGMTQKYLATKLGYNSSSTLSMIENGDLDFSASKVPEIAKILGVDINSLFFEENIRETRNKVVCK